LESILQLELINRNKTCDLDRIMCGISGIYNKNSIVQQDQLELMAKALIHRGPDATGYYISENKTTGLAHDRLSIIDLSEYANQPMCNEDESVWLVFNGEIYNFKKLRDSLIKKGHHFRSEGDSEILIHLYEEVGIDLLEDLNGMFSFCIFDEKNGRLFIARDRVGIKPLYYYFKNGMFAFSSELKALLKLPEISSDLDLNAIDFYFTVGYIPEDLSILRDIKKLKPAHYIEFNGQDINIKNYWNLESRKYSLNNYSEEDLTNLLEDKLRDAVKLRMISDVPIGSFLSGGIDSSLVTTIMAQESENTINTFTIGFKSEEFDETPYAQIIANATKSNHTEHVVEIDAINTLEKLILHFDEPFADSSLIPTYYVSKMAKEHVTVILSGDGGDELFGGYNWYTWVLFLQRLKRKLGSLEKLFPYFGRNLPEHSGLKHLFSALSLDTASQFLERISFFSMEEKEKLYKNRLKKHREQEKSEFHFLKSFDSFKGELIEKMTLTDFHYYLPEDILTKVDRASMAVSLETRVPWLDHKLIEFAYSLPPGFRLNGNKKKYLPKQLAKKILPKNFPLERKQGFCIPLGQWMRGNLGRMLEDELDSKFLTDYIDTKYVYEILIKSRKFKKNNCGPKLFSVLIFALWLKKYMSCL